MKKPKLIECDVWVRVTKDGEAISTIWDEEVVQQSAKSYPKDIILPARIVARKRKVKQ